MAKYVTQSTSTDFSDDNITNVNRIELKEIASDDATSVSVTLGDDAGDDFIVDTNKLVVEGDTGRVGINTAAPGATLGVDGDMHFQPTAISTSHITTAGSLDIRATDNLKIGTDGADSVRIGRTNTALAKVHIRSGADTDLVVANGKVGIGMDDPSDPLEVDGDIQLSPTAITTAHIKTAGSLKIRATNNMHIGDDGVDSIRLGRTNTTGAKVHVRSGADTDLVVSNSKVGVGTDSPSVALDVVGTAAVSGDLGVDGTANLDNTDVDGTLVVDGSNISLDSTSTLNIDNSNTSNGITIGTATSGVPVSIGHSTSEVTVNDNLTVTGNLTVDGTTTTINSTTLTVDDKVVVIASGAADSAAADGAGISVDGASASLLYDHTGTQWEFNKPLEVTGAISSTSTVTATGFTIGSAEIAEAELEMIDGITAGTAAASKAVVLDASSNISGVGTVGCGAITTSGALDVTDTTDATDATGDTGALRIEGGASIAKKLFVGTDLDVDGTANLDAVDIDGAVQVDNTLTIGADDQGYDVTLYGDTASAKVTWDTSVDDLVFSGAAGLVVPAGQLFVGDTAVSSTAAELNKLDGAGADVTAAKLTTVCALTNTEVGYVDGAGTAVVASKAVVCDANKDISTVNNVDVAGYVHFDSTPADSKCSGTTATFTAAEDLSIGEVCYIKSDGKMGKAVASAEGTARCVAMAAAGISANATGVFLLKGFLQSTATFPTYTVGGVLYTPEDETSTENVPEQTAPDTSGDFVQVIGFATGADTVYFDPDSTVIEVA